MSAATPFRDDEADRRAAATDFSRNQLVIAGAGTGKTTLLVERMMNACATQGIPLPSLLALTYTEMAAAEMRERLARGLEALRLLALGRAVSGTPPGESERALAHARARKVPDGETARRASEAIDALDRTTVSTIHGFCADLLRRHPREARLDPRFRVDEGSALDPVFRKTWDAWLAHELGPEGKRAPLWEEVLSRVPVADLEAIARELAASGALADRASLSAGGARAREILKRIAGETARRARAALADPASRAANPSFLACLERAAGCLEAVAKDGWEGRPEGFWTWTENASLPDPGKSKKLPEAARERLERLHKDLKAIRDAFPALDDPFWDRILACLAPWGERFLAAYRGRGFASFDDLLILVRELLLADPRVRGEEKRRFQGILVDEFQDTDPLQYEIVFLLAEREGQALDDPWRAEPAPGKLFIVGDPKQSIYRFRGADIEAFHRARETMLRQGAVERHLTRNFRSVGAILSPVNALFADRMAESSVQPPYIGIHPDPRKPAAEGPRVAIWSMPPGEEGDETAPSARRREGEAIAAWIRHESTARGKPLGDFALLFQATGDIPLYTRPLREAGIPFVIEGGKSFGEKTEVRQFLALLAVLADPDDATAVVALLRSSFGAVPDAQLARHGATRAGWSLRARIDPAACPALAEAHAELRAIHEKAAALPPDRAIRTALADTRLAELAAAAHEGSQRVANLRRLADDACRLSLAEGLSLRETLEALTRGIDEEENRKGESPLADGRTDAVRILTAHKAKGLEFDTVILPDVARGDRDPPPGRVTVARKRLSGGAPALCASLSEGKRKTWNAAGLAAHLSEPLHAEAESLRLLYVALTRAKERLVLVVSPWQKGRPAWVRATTAWGYAHDGKTPPPAARLAEGMVESGPPPFLTAPRAAAGTADASLAPAVAAFREAGARAREDADRPWAETPSSLAEARDQVSEIDDGSFQAPPPSPLSPDVLAAGAGTVIHALLASWDRKDPAGLRAALPAACTAEARARGIPADDLKRAAGEILDAFLASPLAKTFQEIEITARELPFEAAVGGRLLHGAIDLLYRRDGAYVVADFKTDRVRPGGEKELAARYAPQLSAYAGAVRAALALPGTPAREIWLLRSGRILPA